MNILSTFAASSFLRHEDSGLPFLFIIFIFKDLINKKTLFVLLDLSCSVWVL